MRDDMRFALVLRTGSKGFAPNCPFDFGVCLVEGETARTSFVDIEGLASTVGDFPTVPSVYGNIAGIVSFEAEMEAVDALTSSALVLADKYAHPVPPVFGRIREPSDNVVWTSIGDGRLSFELSSWAAAALNWHVGDRVDLACGQNGTSFAIFADKEGSVLIEAGKPGWLTTARDWPLPRRDRGSYGESVVPACVGDGLITFELNAPAAVLPEPPQPPLAPDPLPPTLPIDYRWGLIALAVAYAITSVALNVF